MKGRYPNTKLARYPRMSVEDTKIWNEFIALHGKEFDSFDYDLPVGEGEPVNTSEPAWLQKDWSDLTRKRIDAVGYASGKATIFEVKPRAGTSALGQLLSYKKLFNGTYTQTEVVALAVVTSLILNDERKVYNSFGITVYVLPYG